MLRESRKATVGQARRVPLQVCNGAWTVLSVMVAGISARPRLASVSDSFLRVLGCLLLGLALQPRPSAGLGPMATRIVGRVANQRLTWTRGMVPPPLAAVAAERVVEQTGTDSKTGQPNTLGDAGLAAKSFAASPEGQWTSGFHFWIVPPGTTLVMPTTGSCNKETGEKRPCVWRPALNYTSLLYNRYGPEAAGATGASAETGAPGVTALGFMIDLYGDLHTPVRLGKTTKFGADVAVTGTLSGAFSTTEWGLWEDDTFLSHVLLHKGFHNWTHYADHLARSNIFFEREFRDSANVDLGAIGCFETKLVTDMLSAWGNQSHALLAAEACLRKSSSACTAADPDFFIHLADIIEYQLLLCAARLSNVMDLLFITPPANAVSTACRKNIPFSLDNNILAISVSVIFFVAAVLFFCVFLPKIKSAQMKQQDLARPDSPLSVDSPIGSDSSERSYYRTMDANDRDPY